MSENIPTDPEEPAGEGNEAEGEQKFTQSDVNKIVKDRVARERAKYQGFDELKEKAGKADDLQSQLDKATAELAGIKKAQTVQQLKSRIAQEQNVPAELLDGDDEESLKAKAEVVRKYLNKAPVIPTQTEVPKEAGASENAEYIRSLFGGKQ